MYFDKEDVIKQINIESIFRILSEFGGEPEINQEKTQIISRTICHNPAYQGRRKLYYYDNNKRFKCMTDCGDSFDVFELVARIKNTNGEYLPYKTKEGATGKREWKWNDSISVIANFLGLKGSKQKSAFDNQGLEDWDIFQRHEEIRNSMKSNEIDFTLTHFDKSIIRNMKKDVIIEPWEKDGISREIIRYFDIGFDPVNDAILIPHFDINRNLIGMRTRMLVQEDIDNQGKYHPAYINNMDYSHPLSYNLYGIDKSYANIKRMKKAIVFEGEKSPMLFCTFFGVNNNISCSCCGSSMRRYQLYILLSLGVEEIILAFDKQFQEVGDKEYVKWIENMKKMYQEFSPYVTITFLFDKKGNVLQYKSAPIDEGVEKFKYLVNTRDSLLDIFYSKGEKNEI